MFLTLSSLARAHRPELFSACGRYLRREGAIITRYPVAPGSPLPSLDIVLTLQIGRQPPASPPRCDHATTPLTPAYGAMRAGLEPRIFRRGCCVADAPALQHAWLQQGPLGGSLQARLWSRDCVWPGVGPGALGAKKWPVPVVVGPSRVARRPMQALNRLN